MKRNRMVALVLTITIVVVLLTGCGNEKISETTAATSTEQTPITEIATEINDTQYGVLQNLVDAYGFPFELRYTEGMELTNITIYEDYAKREWHTNNDNTAYDNLKWKLTGDTLEISGEWNESFSLDTERGTATSLTDRNEYRMVVHLPNSIDTKFYVSWPTDEGWTEIDGVRYESSEDFALINAVYMCQFVKDCLAEPDSFQIHGISHIEEDGYHYYYLDFSHEIKHGETEQTYYYTQFVGSTLLCIVNENSAIYYQTDGDYTTKYQVMSSMFESQCSETLDKELILSNLQ